MQSNGESASLAIHDITLQDIPELVAMFRTVLRVTNPNPNEGVSQAWVDDFTEDWLTDGRLRPFMQKMGDIIDDPSQLHQIARTRNELIGFVHAVKRQEGQYLAALYVASHWQRQRVGATLMNRAVEFWDNDMPVSLEVIRYSCRAIDFYLGYGFEITSEPVQWFEGKMPLITMKRPALLG